MRFASIICIVVLLVLAMGITNNAQAFDGERKGFLLGVGLGFGQTSFNEYKGVGTAIQSNFKIGYGFPNNQTQLYYINKVSWAKRTVGHNYDGTANKKRWVTGQSSIGVSHYLLPQAPCFYITGGIGLSASYVFSKEAGKTYEEYDTGMGFFSGVGYEFSRHWSVEVELMTGRHPNTHDNDYTDSDWTIRATFNALAY